MTENKRIEYNWGHMLWWLDGTAEDRPDISTAKMVLNPNAISEEHFHNNCYEFILVNQGIVEIVLNGVSNSLEKNNTILIPPNTNHYVINKTDEEADLTIVYSAAVRNYSTP